jgi:hypothetical protein
LEKDMGISGTARGRTERVKAWRRPAFGDEGVEGAGGRGDTQAVSIESAFHLSINDFVTSHKTCAVVLGHMLVNPSNQIAIKSGLQNI